MSKDLIIRSSSAEFLIFERQTHDKGIQVRFEDGDLWLTQKAIGELFDIDRTVVTKDDTNNHYDIRTSKHGSILFKNRSRINIGSGRNVTASVAILLHIFVCI